MPTQDIKTTVTIGGGVSSTLTDSMRKLGTEATKVELQIKNLQKSQDQLAKLRERNERIQSPASSFLIGPPVPPGFKFASEQKENLKEEAEATEKIAENTSKSQSAMSKLGKGTKTFVEALNTAIPQLGNFAGFVRAQGKLPLLLGTAVVAVGALAAALFTAGTEAVKLANQIRGVVADSEDFQRVAGALDLVTLGLTNARAAAFDFGKSMRQIQAATLFGLGAFPTDLSRLFGTVGGRFNIRTFAELEGMEAMITYLADFSLAARQSAVHEAQFVHGIQGFGQATQDLMLGLFNGTISQNQLSKSISNAVVMSAAEIKAQESARQAMDDLGHNFVDVRNAIVRGLLPAFLGLLKALNWFWGINLDSSIEGLETAIRDLKRAEEERDVVKNPLKKPSSVPLAQIRPVDEPGPPKSWMQRQGDYLTDHFTDPMTYFDALSPTWGTARKIFDWFGHRGLDETTGGPTRSDAPRPVINDNSTHDTRVEIKAPDPTGTYQELEGINFTRTN